MLLICLREVSFSDFKIETYNEHNAFRGQLINRHHNDLLTNLAYALD